VCREKASGSDEYCGTVGREDEREKKKTWKKMKGKHRRRRNPQRIQGGNARRERRYEDRSRRTGRRKEMEIREERRYVSKKYETKTKGRRRKREKETPVEYETHTRSHVERIYSLPVRRMGQSTSKENDSDEG